MREKAHDKQSRSRYQSSNARDSDRRLTKPAEGKRTRCLKILGLDPLLSYKTDELKTAYRKKVKKTHPDTGGSQSEFIEVVNAYECPQKNPGI
jgi:DnaJ-class molecular chaperone